MSRHIVDFVDRLLFHFEPICFDIISLWTEKHTGRVLEFSRLCSEVQLFRGDARSRRGGGGIIAGVIV